MTTEVTDDKTVPTGDVNTPNGNEDKSQASIKEDTSKGSSTTTTVDKANTEGDKPVNETKDSKNTLLGNKDKVNKLQSLVSDAGLTPTEVAREVTDNDGEVSPETLKALIDKHGEAVGSLIAEKLETLHSENVQAAQARDKAVFDQVAEAFKGATEQSGEESWKELAGWAKENISNEERQEINDLLGKGGIASKLAVQYVVDAFKNSDDFQQPAVLESGDDTPQDFSSGAIDRTTYVRELDKLLDAGHDYNTSPEIRKLEQRRQKGIQRGI